uniref:Putative secreted protein n=1 Tax=Anopheles darlingi TaxID=43151 RepID=A0A2M4D8U6_ANODA
MTMMMIIAAAQTAFGLLRGILCRQSHKASREVESIKCSGHSRCFSGGKKALDQRFWFSIFSGCEIML